jgi:hypothetical protein
MSIPYLYSNLLVCVMAEHTLVSQIVDEALHVIKINLDPNQFLPVVIIPPVFPTPLHPNNTLFRRTSSKSQAIVYQSNAVCNVRNTGDESLSPLVVWSSSS